MSTTRCFTAKIGRLRLFVSGNSSTPARGVFTTFGFCIPSTDFRIVSEFQVRLSSLELECWGPCFWKIQ